MTVPDLLRDQLLDPLRIGLLVALVATMLRTEAATGRWLPLAAGAAFVAAIRAATLGAPEGTTLVMVAGVGLLANAILLALILALWGAWVRLRR